MNITFLRNTKAEFLKSKGTFAYWLTFFGALFIPAINFMICFERPDVMVPKFRIDSWFVFLKFNWKNVATVILPMYVILINTLIVQIEYRNNTWKQVYTLPRTFTDIFFSKFAVINTLLPLFIILFNIFILLSGLSLHAVNPKYPLVPDTVLWKTMLLISARIYVGTLAITVIQYWLSLRFRNFIVPLGMGIGLWIAGIVLIDWEKIIYYPYVYSIFIFFNDSPNHPDELMKLMINSVVCFVAVLVLSYWDIYRRPERG